MIHRMPPSGKKLNPFAGIYGRGKDDLLKKIPVHVMEQEKVKEGPLFSADERLVDEILVPSRSAREMTLLFRKREEDRERRYHNRAQDPSSLQKHLP